MVCLHFKFFKGCLPFKFYLVLDPLKTLFNIYNGSFLRKYLLYKYFSIYFSKRKTLLQMLEKVVKRPLRMVGQILQKQIKKVQTHSLNDCFTLRFPLAKDQEKNGKIGLIKVFAITSLLQNLKQNLIVIYLLKQVGPFSRQTRVKDKFRLHLFLLTSQWMLSDVSLVNTLALVFQYQCQIQ